MDTHELPQPHQWASMNDVPEPWRTLRGSRLTLEQINWLARRAYETGSFSSGEGHEPVFVPNWGGARQELIDTHIPVNGFLVPQEGN